MDKELMYVVQKNKHNWKKIQKVFCNGRFTINALKARLRVIYDTQPTKGVPFKVHEDLRIVKYFQLYGLDWDTISQHFENRSSIMIKNRFYSHIKKKNLLNKMIKKVDDFKKRGVDIDALSPNQDIELDLD